MTVQESRTNQHVRPTVPFRFSRRPSPRTFALRVSGDCQYPVYEDGDFVAVDPDAIAGDGDFVVADTSEGWLLKRLRITPKDRILDVQNRAYADCVRVLRADDRIVGVVIGSAASSA